MQRGSLVGKAGEPRSKPRRKRRGFKIREPGRYQVGWHEWVDSYLGEAC